MTKLGGYRLGYCILLSIAAKSLVISEPAVWVRVGGTLIKAEQLKLEGMLGK